MAGGGARRCSATCQDAKSDPAACECVCRGALHGKGHDAVIRMDWDALNEIRATIPLAEGEQVQMRIGA